MKTFRVHLIWACVTVVSAAAWGKWVLHTGNAETVQRASPLPERSVAPAAVTSSPVVLRETPAARTSQSAAGKPEEDPETRIPPSDQIRRLVRSTAPDDLWKARGLIFSMANSPLRVELIRELLKSREEAIRVDALYLFRDSVTVEAAAPIFQEILRTDPSAEVRRIAAGLVSAHYAPGNDEALLHAFEREDLRIQVICAEGLSKWGHPGPAVQLVPRIAPAMESPDGGVRREATEQLSKLRSPQALPLLAGALRDSNSDVRQEAVNGLWKFEDPRLASLLEPLLNDPIRTVRESAKELYDNLKQRGE